DISEIPPPPAAQASSISGSLAAASLRPRNTRRCQYSETKATYSPPAPNTSNRGSFANNRCGTSQAGRVSALITHPPSQRGSAAPAADNPSGFNPPADAPSKN